MPFKAYSGFEVWNKNLFTSTGAFDCVALLHRDGELYQQQKLANIDAVSYTHLDVYKRQIYNRYSVLRNALYCVEKGSIWNLTRK